MNIRTHRVTGLATALVTTGICANKINFNEINWGVACNLGQMTLLGIGIVVGSIYPDVDYAKSTINKDEDIKVQAVLGHRGIIHTPFGVLIMAAMWILPELLLHFIVNLFTSVNLLWLTFYGIGLTIGYLLHLIEDSMTPKGIMWLYPYSRRKYKFLKKGIKTDQAENNFLILYSLIFVIIGSIIWATKTSSLIMALPKIFSDLLL